VIEGKVGRHTVLCGKTQGTVEKRRERGRDAVWMQLGDVRSKPAKKVEKIEAKSLGESWKRALSGVWKVRLGGHILSSGERRFFCSS